MKAPPFAHARAKGVSAAAVMNAVSHALRRFGARVSAMPSTPGRILATLGRI